MLAAGREINLDILPIPGATNLPRRTAVAAKHCDPFQDKPPNPGPGETVELVPDLFRWQGEVEFDPAGTPEPEVWFRGDMCVRPLLPDEIKVAYSNATAAGTGWIIVTGTDRFTGTVRLPYRIAPRAIDVECRGFYGAYDGKGHGVSLEFYEPVPNARVSYAGSENGPFAPLPILQTNASDNATKVFVRIEAENYVPFSAECTVFIEPRELGRHAKVFVCTNRLAYAGPHTRPVFTIIDEDLGILGSNVYSLECHVYNGVSGEAIVRGANNFGGSLFFRYETTPAELSADMFEPIPPQSWTGDTILPEILPSDVFPANLVTGEMLILPEGNCVDPGKGTVRVISHGGIEGEITLDFEILEPDRSAPLP